MGTTTSTIAAVSSTVAVAGAYYMYTITTPDMTNMVDLLDKYYKSSNVKKLTSMGRFNGLDVYGNYTSSDATIYSKYDTAAIYLINNYLKYIPTTATVADILPIINKIAFTESKTKINAYTGSNYSNPAFDINNCKETFYNLHVLRRIYLNLKQQGVGSNIMTCIADNYFSNTQAIPNEALPVPANSQNGSSYLIINYNISMDKCIILQYTCNAGVLTNGTIADSTALNNLNTNNQLYSILMVTTNSTNTTYTSVVTY